METIQSLREHRVHLLLCEWFLAPRQEDFEEAAHVRALKLHRQGDGEYDACEHLLIAARLFLDEKGQTHFLDADALNRDATTVLTVLYVQHHRTPAAYGIGSRCPASAKPRRRRTQLSQVPHASFPPR